MVNQPIDRAHQIVRTENGRFKQGHSGNPRGGNTAPWVPYATRLRWWLETYTLIEFYELVNDPDRMKRLTLLDVGIVNKLRSVIDPKAGGMDNVMDRIEKNKTLQEAYDEAESGSTAAKIKDQFAETPEGISAAAKMFAEAMKNL